ncbi:hypothetical protein [Burkholderia cepacia]|uniref:hypothetical protein n=1 Tax=Burkholderia cepacia TaxID=292 RepID=UPI0012DA7C74|nr:hypothetical protein [Burkholderia cepacia]
MKNGLIGESRSGHLLFCQGCVFRDAMRVERYPRRRSYNCIDYRIFPFSWRASNRLKMKNFGNPARTLLAGLLAFREGEVDYFFSP